MRIQFELRNRLRWFYLLFPYFHFFAALDRVITLASDNTNCCLITISHKVYKAARRRVCFAKGIYQRSKTVLLKNWQEATIHNVFRIFWLQCTLRNLRYFFFCFFHKDWRESMRQKRFSQREFALLQTVFCFFLLNNSPLLWHTLCLMVQACVKAQSRKYCLTWPPFSLLAVLCFLIIVYLSLSLSLNWTLQHKHYRNYWQ